MYQYLRQLQQADGIPVLPDLVVLKDRKDSSAAMKVRPQERAYML